MAKRGGGIRARARGRAERSRPARPFRQREQRRGARPRQSRSPQSAGAAWHLQRQYSYFCTSKASKLKYRRVVAQLPQAEEALEDLGVVRHHTALAHVCAEHRLAALEQLVVQRALRRRQLHPPQYLYFRTSKASKLSTCRRRSGADSCSRRCVTICTLEPVKQVNCVPAGAARSLSWQASSK